jgi:hypothetical protein
MAGPDPSGVSARDDKLRIAEFARMLAENEKNWLSDNACSADAPGESNPPVGVADEDDNDRSTGCSGESSPTVAPYDDDDDDIGNMQFEPAKVNPIQQDTTHLLYEIQELRAQNDELNNNVDQLTGQLETKTSEYGEAQMFIQSQQKSLEKMKELALYEIRKQASAQASVLQSKVDTLQSENQQLQQSTTAATNMMMNRLDRFYADKDSDKEQIQRLSEERLRLSDELLKTVQAQLKTVEAQLDDKVDEVETLKCKLATIGTLNAAQSEKLSATCAELKEARDTIEANCKEIISLKSPAIILQRDEQEASRIKRKIALFVTQLDLGYYGYRMWTCRHDKLSDIPDRYRKSTRFHDMSLVARGLFSDWAKDQEFMDHYHKERQIVISHHQAHDHADPGRGVGASEVTNTC